MGVYRAILPPVFVGDGLFKMMEVDYPFDEDIILMITPVIKPIMDGIFK